jgi:hypothetical protein
MTYHAKITSYDFQTIEGEPAIVIRSINVFDDKGNFIRQAQLSKIIHNFTTMNVTFDTYRPQFRKGNTDTLAIRNLIKNAKGDYLPELDKQIVLDWFIRAYPDQYRKLEGKYTDIALDNSKCAILFVKDGALVYAVDGVVV